MTLTAAQQADLATGEAVAQSIAPLLPPKVQIALALAAAAIQLVQQFSATGDEPSDAEIQALFDQYAANKADDLLAQKAAGA